MLQSYDVVLEAVTVLAVFLMWQLDVNLHHVPDTRVTLQLCLVKLCPSTDHNLLIYLFSWSFRGQDHFQKISMRT